MGGFARTTVIGFERVPAGAGPVGDNGRSCAKGYRWGA
jgi:hypothetical protein